MNDKKRNKTYITKYFKRVRIKRDRLKLGKKKSKKKNIKIGDKNIPRTIIYSV